VIVIIGAGLAGMSASYHLSRRGIKNVVYEKSAVAGGLCRSYVNNNLTFDLAGHFLHMRSEEAVKLAGELLGDNLVLRERNAAIVTGKDWVPFPFQAHLGFMDREKAAECLESYIRALLGKRSRRKNFGEWLKATFGEGMYRHFFRPYNEKFWKCGLDEILPDWTSWSVPRPDVHAVVRGALGIENRRMGYNSTFYYPRRGGIGALAETLAGEVKSLIRRKRVVEIDARRRKVILSDGEEEHYDVLINTAPMTDLIPMIRDATPTMKRGAENLRRIAVDCVQLGFKRPEVIKRDWIYVPDAEYPFHRIGKYPGSETDEGTALFVEYTRPHDLPAPDAGELIDKSVEGLRKLGIIRGIETPDVAEVVVMDPAYVVYDVHRRRFLRAAGPFLERRGICSIGRYGAWEYSTMEDAMLAGMKVAEDV